DYLNANNMNADWDQVDAASTEVLVNTLSLLAPYPAKEKQALLEAPDLKTRADVLVALTEMALARGTGGPRSRLQ
ncbi:MAG TPA: peptidase S16, partial [Kiloniellales bacterium]